MGVALFFIAALILMGGLQMLVVGLAGIALMFLFVFSSMAIGKIFLRT